MPKGMVAIDEDRCKGCGLCVEACPFGVLAVSSTFNRYGYNVATMAAPEKCTGCTMCAQMCPDAAIEVFLFRPAKEAV